MSTVKLTSAPTNFDFTKKTVTGDVPKGSSDQLDLYSYTGRVKFFDKDKGFGYIQEIPDTNNLKNVVKEWRVTAEQLGAAEIHRGDFVYFMKHGKTIGEISPINLRDLLKTPCPDCGRRDYVPGKDSCCPNCGHIFKKMAEEKKSFTVRKKDTTSDYIKELRKINEETARKQSRDDDPAYNCLAGTNKDKPCSNCGRRAWKRYGFHQNIRCRCCGTVYYKLDWGWLKIW